MLVLLIFTPKQTYQCSTATTTTTITTVGDVLRFTGMFTAEQCIDLHNVSGQHDEDSNNNDSRLTDCDASNNERASLHDALHSDEGPGGNSDATDTCSVTESNGYLNANWNDLDLSADEAEEITNRLALVNMDWDRIKASDLFILFKSFVPDGGALCSVTIYPSEEGLTRMAEEDKFGPKEFLNTSNHPTEIEGEFNQDKVRKYQLNRLRNFYSVIVCDSKETANKIYTDCDKMEYLKSSCYIDLRFIPDNTHFTEQPKDQCTASDDLENYEPLNFLTSVFSAAVLKSSWDETDIRRLKRTMKRYTADELEKEQFDDLIAPFYDDSDVECDESNDLENRVIPDDERSRKSLTIRQKRKNVRKCVRSVLKRDKSGKKRNKTLKKSPEHVNSDDADTKSEKHKPKDKKCKTNSNKAGFEMLERGSRTDSCDGHDIEICHSGLLLSNDVQQKPSPIDRLVLEDTDKICINANTDHTLTGVSYSDLHHKQSNKRCLNSIGVVDEADNESCDGNMEYTWLTSTGHQQYISRQKRKLTPWEEFEHKKRSKRREKREQRKLRTSGKQSEHSAVRQDLGFDDPWFVETGEPTKVNTKKAKFSKKKRSEGEDLTNVKVDTAVKKERAMLQLLMEDQEKSDHFNLVSLMKEEDEIHKGNNCNHVSSPIEGNGDLLLNFDDPRFSDLYTDPDLHIDPTAPQFKKNKSMELLMGEVAKRKHGKKQWL